MEAGVITCFNDIVLMHQRVLDMWVNPQTMQSGPSVDRILDKGLVVFLKLASLDLAAAVEFYNQLQKTLALFLLPLMLFDAVNLHMGKGTGGKYVIFSNGPNSTSECSKLLY
jgi:hypothetical protein